MATLRWTGGAVDVQDIWTFTPGGTIEAGSTFTFDMGVIAWVYTTTASDVAGVCQELAEIWNSTDPLVQPPAAFRELQALDNTTTMTLVGKLSGRAHAIAVTAGGSGSPTGSVTNTQPATGRKFPANPDNYAGGTAPANSDTIVFDAGDVELSEGLAALTSVTGLTIKVLPGCQRFRMGRLPFVGTGAARYAEYRPRFLEIDGGTLEVNCPRANRVFIDFQDDNDAAVIVRETGQREEATTPVVLIRGSDAQNVANITKGDVGFAFYAEDTANFPVMNLSYRDNQADDAVVDCGAGCSLGAITKGGGVLVTRTNVTTLVQAPNGGRTTVEAGAVTTASIDGGTLVYNSTGTLATARVSNDGFIDFDQDPRAKTVTNPINKYGDRSRIRDTNKVVNSGALVVQCIRSTDLPGIEFGSDFKVTFGAVS